MNENNYIYAFVKKIVKDKLLELGKSEAFIKAANSRYLDTVVDEVEELIDNEINYWVEQSSISEL